MSSVFSRSPAIVLVDDEPDILIILHRHLREIIDEEYDVVAVDEGEEALAHLALRSVPLVITDYKLRGMDGLQLTKTIKEQSPNTRVVLITAYATPELEQRAREHQVDYYLPKPFPFDHFDQIVRDVIESKPITRLATSTSHDLAETLSLASRVTLAEAEHLYATVQHHYQIIGAPYGNNHNGMMRWLEGRLSCR